MRSRFLRLAGPVVAAAWLALAATLPAAAQDTCMSNVDVQAAISRGEIAPLAQVLQGAGIARGTQVLSAEVCQSNGSWAYFVSVLDASGQARTLVLQANG